MSAAPPLPAPLAHAPEAGQAALTPSEGLRALAQALGRELARKHLETAHGHHGDLRPIFQRPAD